MSDINYDLFDQYSTSLRVARLSHLKKSKKHVASSYSSGGSLSGKASYYWQPQRVASGGWFNPNAMTAAHRTLPFGTLVLVKNTETGEMVTVRINDRGPYVKGRIIDLSRAAAQKLGISGVQRVALYRQLKKTGTRTANLAEVR